MVPALTILASIVIAIWAAVVLTTRRTPNATKIKIVLAIVFLGFLMFFKGFDSEAQAATINQMNGIALSGLVVIIFGLVFGIALAGFGLAQTMSAIAKRGRK